jgi:hypothetical protein
MTDYLRREIAKMRRVSQFADDNPLNPANAAATTEVTAINTTLSAIDIVATAQESGKGTASGAVNHRLVLVKLLLDLMRSLAKAAKVLDPEAHPDVAAKMRMSGIKNFEELMARARLFHNTLQPIEAEFIALGASATVAADLLARITAVQGSWDLKLTGLDTQIGGTRGLKFEVREGLKHVRKLDAILCQVYRENPVLLEQWKAACRAERPAAKKSEETPDTGSGGASGSTTVVA